MLTATLSATHTTATARTLHIWLLSNLGGTAWLVFDFCRDSLADVAVPLVIGLMAALFSLVTVPVAIPFFALVQRMCAGWRCRLTALAGVLLVFALGNFVLLKLLPIGPASSLLSLSRPYLGAALAATLWLYRPRPALHPAPATGRFAVARGTASWVGLA